MTSGELSPFFHQSAVPDVSEGAIILRHDGKLYVIDTSLRGE